MPEKNVHKSSF